MSRFRPWPGVRWERLKYLRWVLRNPLGFVHYGHYARSTGHHLSMADRFKGWR
jgi:hypothetical protein